MRTLGNIIWHIPFLGFLNVIFVWFLALLFAITIVGFPIAKGLFEFGKFLVMPFSREMVSVQKDESILIGIWNPIMSVIWILCFGIWIWIYMIFQIVALFMSIVGIPVAIVLAKSLSVCFNPVGKKCVLSKN